MMPAPYARARMNEGPGYSSEHRDRATRRVWDAPVRVFHWLLVACFATLWLTRGARQADLHAAAGYAMLALLAFRVAWGFLGTPPARFTSFLYSPQSAWRHLCATFRRKAPDYASHNPAGSWSIYVLLLLGLCGCLAGLVVFGGEKNAGPFAGLVDAITAETAHRVHEFTAWSMLAIVAVHLFGVALSSWSHRENFLAAMITGAKSRLPAGYVPAPARRPVAFALLACVAALVILQLAQSGWLEDYASARQRAKAAPRPAASVWRSECSECHLAYAPELLPARSWTRMLEEQSRHFGDDLGLDEAKIAQLAAWARGLSRPDAWPGAALRAEVAPSQSPQRITETSFWKRQHASVESSAFKSAKVSGKHDCGACHADAESGIFHFRLIRIPKRETVS